MRITISPSMLFLLGIFSAFLSDWYCGAGVSGLATGAAIVAAFVVYSSPGVNSLIATLLPLGRHLLP
jgi:hypothetical protein